MNSISGRDLQRCGYLYSDSSVLSVAGVNVSLGGNITTRWTDGGPVDDGTLTMWATAPLVQSIHYARHSQRGFDVYRVLYSMHIYDFYDDASRPAGPLFRESCRGELYVHGDVYTTRVSGRADGVATV